jgi:hypothetical protein
VTDAERYLATGRPLWLVDRIYVQLDSRTGWYAFVTLNVAGERSGREYFATFEALREQHGARMAEAVKAKAGND